MFIFLVAAGNNILKGSTNSNNITSSYGQEQQEQKLQQSTTIQRRQQNAFSKNANNSIENVAANTASDNDKRIVTLFGLYGAQKQAADAVKRKNFILHLAATKQDVQQVTDTKNSTTKTTSTTTKWYRNTLCSLWKEPTADIAKRVRGAATVEFKQQQKQSFSFDKRWKTSIFCCQDNQEEVKVEEVEKDGKDVNAIEYGGGKRNKQMQLLMLEKTETTTRNGEFCISLLLESVLFYVGSICQQGKKEFYYFSYFFWYFCS